SAPSRAGTGRSYHPARILTPNDTELNRSWRGRAWLRTFMVLIERSIPEKAAGWQNHESPNVSFHHRMNFPDSVIRYVFATVALIFRCMAHVNPDLVVCDNDGEIYSVRYEAVNAMLLNEFLKTHLSTRNRKRQSQN